MRRRELARYHDIAASTKTRGEGIGFAGVGIKLGLLLRGGPDRDAARQAARRHAWHLASRHRAPWQWVPPPGLVAERGTAVRLRSTNALSPLLDAGFVEARPPPPLPAAPRSGVRRASCRAHYPRGVRFDVNGRPLERRDLRERPEIGAARRPRRRASASRRPPAISCATREPLPEERRGLAVSTFGKVIKRGWDWLGLAPAAPERIGGLIEVPALAECLTLNKADFIRTGPRGATYLAYRKAIQEAVSRQLAAWGDAREPRRARPPPRGAAGRAGPRARARRSGRRLPAARALVERRAGGQRRLPAAGAGRDHRPNVRCSSR